MDYMGVCCYCGQVRMVKGGEDMDEAIVNKIASEECDCEEGRMAREVEKKRTYAAANIKSLLEGDGESLRASCLELVEPMAMGRLQKATVVSETGIQVTMTDKGKRIKIERKEIIKKALED